MRPNVWIAGGAVAASIGVACGAVGSHMLKEQLASSDLETYEIAVRYQMYHALGLILIGMIAARTPGKLVTAAGLLLALGMVLFSGGIYAWLATGQKPFIAVVPIGGVSWIVGWLVLAAGAIAHKTASQT